MVLYRGFSTQEELDEQYNLRESVPDFPTYERLYKEQSEKTREQLECQLDVPFGPTLDESLEVFPAARSGALILVFIHVEYCHTVTSKVFSFVASGAGKDRSDRSHVSGCEDDLWLLDLPLALSFVESG